MDKFLAVLREWYIACEDFVLDMTVDLAHDYLFLTPHFPIFFAIQSLFICICVRHFNNKIQWWKSLIVSYGMEFTGRVLTALVTYRKPPLLENPLYSPCFLLIWLLVNASPFDLVFKIFNSGFMYFVLQILISLIQVRESCHGVDIGLRAFPASIVGSVMTACVLSCTESFVWLIALPGKCRHFSPQVAIRNLCIACAYLGITQYSEYIPSYIDTSREFVKTAILGIVLVIMLLDDVIFGLRGSKGLDCSGLTYATMLFKFQGGK